MSATKSTKAAERRLARIHTAVKAAGVKLTPQRVEIFREIALSCEHPMIDAVYQAVKARMPTVSQDTVYRTLWLMHELGLATTIGAIGDGVRFDANVDPHHHYVCVRCGLVRDFESTELDALRLPAGVRQLGSVTNAHVEVRGVCAQCSLDSLPTRRSPPERKSTHRSTS